MNGAPQGPPQPPQPPQVMVVNQPCMACGTIMRYTLPAPKVMNYIDMSMIIFMHYRPDICPACKAMFLPVIEKFDENGAPAFIWKPVGGHKQPMIVGGNDQSLRDAINKAAFEEKLKREGN
jgi:hypothetical protein